MKYILSLLAALFSSFSANSQDGILKHDKISKSNIVIIDVRTLGEFKSGNIAGSVLIPFNEISQKISKYAKTKDTPIAVYCQSGSRSRVAFRTLESMGYTNAVNYGSFSKAKSILDNKK